MLTPTQRTAVALDAWNDIKAGNRRIVSDETLDALSDHFSPLDSADASMFFFRLATERNPQQIGTKDQYIAFLR